MWYCCAHHRSHPLICRKHVSAVVLLAWALCAASWQRKHTHTHTGARGGGGPTVTHVCTPPETETCGSQLSHHTSTASQRTRNPFRQAFLEISPLSLSLHIWSIYSEHCQQDDCCSTCCSSADISSSTSALPLPNTWLRFLWHDNHEQRSLRQPDVDHTFAPRPLRALHGSSFRFARDRRRPLVPAPKLRLLALYLSVAQVETAFFIQHPPTPPCLQSNLNDKTRFCSKVGCACGKMGDPCRQKTPEHHFPFAEQSTPVFAPPPGLRPSTHGGCFSFCRLFRPCARI